MNINKNSGFGEYKKKCFLFWQFSKHYPSSCIFFLFLSPLKLLGVHPVHQIKLLLNFFARASTRVFLIYDYKSTFILAIEKQMTFILAILFLLILFRFYIYLV